MSLVLESEAAARHPFRTVQGVDNMAWARRFIYRLERGDKTLLPVQVTFAKMALGIKDEVKA